LNPSVFVSRPAVLSAAQEQLCRRWTDALRGEPLNTVHIPRSAYRSDSWAQLRDVLSQVDGVVILGVRQLSARSAVWRASTGEEQTLTTSWTSPWMQIEAGMALMRDLPVLVVPEAGVAEGVFDRSRWHGSLFGIDLEHEPLGPAGAVWRDAVRARAASHAGMRPPSPLS
jgi:hypothetical protein